MRVCLISLKKPYLLNPMACPPLGLMTVSSYFKSKGYEVELVDLNKREEIPEADLYGISITTPDFYEAIKVKNEIKSKYPNSKVIVGGPHATICPEECKKHFDEVWIGEIDPNIDKYHPDRDIVNLWDYEFYVDGRATTMLTAHGCLWAEKTGGCVFCSRYQKLKYHSLDFVREEIEDIKKHGFSSIMIYDDEFFTFPERDEKIVEMLGNNNIKWRCFGHSLYIIRNKDLVKKAADNGLREVLLGIESGSRKILKVIRKGTTPELNEKAIKLLYDLGIRVKAACIVGLPSESKETLRESWEWYSKVRNYITDWDFTVCTPYPGSDIYNHPEKYDFFFDRSSIYTAYKGYGTKDWIPPKIWTSKLTFEEMMKARDEFEREFKC